MPGRWREVRREPASQSSQALESEGYRGAVFLETLESGGQREVEILDFAVFGGLRFRVVQFQFLIFHDSDVHFVVLCTQYYSVAAQAL